MPSLRKTMVYVFALTFIAYVLLFTPKGEGYPIASFTYSPSDPAAGETVTFDASGSYDSNALPITSYEWSFGDGNNGTGIVVTHTYASVGVYNVALTVTNTQGGYGFISKNLTVYTHDVAIINVIIPAVEVYQGQVVNITVVAKNQGTAVETFNVTLYRYEAALETQQVIELEAQMDAVLTFSWDTTSVIPDVGYVFKAKADVVRGEKDTRNNWYFTSVVLVKSQAIPTNPLLTILNLILPYALSLGFIFSLAGGIAWKKLKTGPATAGFEFFNEMTGGGIPDAYSVMISGDAGSGKSVLCQQLASAHLQQGKPCIYVTYDSFPDEVRESMKNLHWDTSTFEQNGTFKFIDCYSAVAGKRSPEKHSVEQPYSLSDLGIAMTVALNEVRQKSTRVFLDSTTPLFMRLNPSDVMEFLQDRTAKIKGDDGTFIFTIGKQTIPPDIMSGLEDIVDCIIELATHRVKGKTSRTLRVKRLRGRGFPDMWVPFKIESKKGLVFMLPRKRASKGKKIKSG